MKLVDRPIARSELKQLAEKKFGNFVKAVVDLEQKIMAIDADLHADEESLLLEKGAKQEDLWGINLYPELTGEDFIEFDSMINLRPAQGNRSRNVEDPAVRQKVASIVHSLIKA
ncbi:MAG: hypothetical protein JW873_04690 [Candidatus Saganbacteria bacterium]|nr:hypothetical protein [Candidatus Saganbacteria bacterium]